MMTKTATVIRHNDETGPRISTGVRVARAGTSLPLGDRSGWLNQDVVFVRALEDMFPLARTILKGAILRDECRGAHYKPEFAPSEVTAADPAERYRQAEAWCERFEENNRKWLKTTLASLSADGEPEISYEEVDTSLILPRPRLYGVAGSEVIEEVARKRQPRRHHADERITRPARVRPADEAIRRADSAPGRPRPAELLGAAHGPAGAGHELHQRVAEDRRKRHCGRRPQGGAGRLAVQLPGGGLRRLHDGHQRRVRQACTALVDELLRQRPGEIELRPMSKFPVLRDLVVERSRIFASLEKVKAWVPADSYYDLGAGARQSQEEQELAYQYSKCMSCGCCLEACPQFLKIELVPRQGETREQLGLRVRRANLRRSWEHMRLPRWSCST